MEIKTLDKRNLPLLRVALQAAVEVVGKQYGVKITMGNARFTPESATFKMEVATVGDGGAVNTRQVADFKNYGSMYGLKPEHLGAEITYGGERYSITGLASGKSYKYPILVKRLRDGKGFKLPESAVKSLTGDGGRTFPPTTASDFVIGVRNPNHAEIERRIAKMRNDCPEGYYGDGEHHAAGLGERQIHDMHYVCIAKQIAAEKSGKSPLFGSVPVMPPPGKK